MVTARNYVPVGQISIKTFITWCLEGELVANILHIFPLPKETCIGMQCNFYYRKIVTKNGFYIRMSSLI